MRPGLPMRGIIPSVPDVQDLQCSSCGVARRIQHCSVTTAMSLVHHSMMLLDLALSITIDSAVFALQMVLQGADVIVLVLDSACKARCLSTEGCNPALKELCNSSTFFEVIPFLKRWNV